MTVEGTKHKIMVVGAHAGDAEIMAVHWWQKVHPGWALSGAGAPYPRGERPPHYAS